MKVNLEPPGDGKMERRVHVDYFSVGALGATDFSNSDLEELADIVIEMAKRGDRIEKIEKFLREYDWWSEYASYEIEGRNRIILYDDIRYGGGRLRKDKITITILPKRPKLLSEFKKVARKIKNRDKYEVVEFEIVSPYDSPFGDFDFHEGDIITGKELKRFIKSVISYIVSMEEECSGYADGYEVDAEPLDTEPDPYSTYGYYWWFTGDTEELKIGVQYILMGVCEEHVIFRRIGDERERRG